MEIHRLGSVGPVTALCIHGDIIVAGCGSQVQVYQTETNEIVTSFSALPCVTIHGFRLGPLVDGKKSICVFGAKHARILYLDSRKQDDVAKKATQCIRFEPATDVTEFEDWIWDALWLQNENQWTVAFALAHNIVLHWDWSSGAILHRATCAEKCILYCARLIGSTWSDLVLAAGTVFNQVVIWSPNNSQQSSNDGDQNQPVLHQLTGHKGVIFSIFYHAGHKRICSASDDRSIIMYQLCLPTISKPSSSSWRDAIVVDWNHATIEPLMTVFGHSGRVWDVVLLADQFVSVGEDAHCIVWNYSGEILQKNKGHKGQNIWSLAASEDESFVVTGGGDCSIRQWQLHRNLESPMTQVQLTVPDHLKTCPDDFVRSLVLWNYDTVVLTTNAGSVLCYTVVNDTWETLLHDADFSQYSTMAVSTHRTYLAIASITGHVVVFCKQVDQVKSDTIREGKTKLHTGKICGLTWVRDDYFLTTGLKGHCVLATVQHTSERNLTVSVVRQLELPACKYRWMVSGCLLLSPVQSSSESGPEAHLVCGDRSGSIHCYQLSLEFSEAEGMLLPVQTFPKVHGKAGVTCVCHYDSTVYTAGRDGQYRRWILEDNQLQLLNSSRVFKGFDWIDHLWVGENGLYILGFHSSKFIVWDTGRSERLLEVECGGGHRAWDCLPQAQAYCFVFIKAREVVMVNSSQKSTQDIIKSPLHGMKMWDLKKIYSYADGKGGAYHILCTGSEDTTLSLGVLHSDSRNNCLQWTGQHTLQSHLSSVRTLATTTSCLDQHNFRENSDSHHSSPGVASPVCPPDVPANRPTSKETITSPSVSKVVFSAGGRAQIQAWRVKIAEQNVWPCHHQADQDRSQEAGATAAIQKGVPQGIKTNYPIKEKTFDKTLPDSKINVENTFTTGSCLSSLPVKNDPECPHTGQNSFISSYEHLGGCFLGESRHKRSHKPWKTRYLKLDPETRIMSLTAVTAHQLDSRLSASLHLLAAAGSDGILRLFLFDEVRHHFTLLCQSSYHNGCILKVLIHLHPRSCGSQSHATSDTNPSSSDLQPVLLSAATDGCIAVWDLQPIVQWLLTNVELQSSCRQDSTTNPRKGNNRFHCTIPEKKERRDLVEEQLGATAHGHCEGQEMSGDVGLGDDIEDDDERCSDEACEETIPGARVTQPVMTRNQYLGDTPSLLSRQQLYAAHLDKPSTKKMDGVSEEEDLHKNWTPCQDIPAHQSGVNSLHIRSFADGSLILASGGDDNALTIHKLTCTVVEMDQGTVENYPSTGGPLFTVERKISKPDAHAAQITGVWVLSKDHIVTASIDQRINLWQLTQDSQLELEGCRFVDVADLSNMEVWQNQDKAYIGVCGEGIALLSVPSH